MPIGHTDLDRWFRHHAPTDKKLDQYMRIREAARKFAGVVLDETPACADQTVAIRMIREAMMTANAAVACDGQ